jgi:hypothetical protein
VPLAAAGTSAVLERSSPAPPLPTITWLMPVRIEGLEDVELAGQP